MGDREQGVIRGIRYYVVVGVRGVVVRVVVFVFGVEFEVVRFELISGQEGYLDVRESRDKVEFIDKLEFTFVFY